MSTVILAEKPSQALAYASALKQSTKDGYFGIKAIFADETFITFWFWAFSRVSRTRSL